MPTSDITNNSFATATELTGINNSGQGRTDQLLNSLTNPLDFYRFKLSGSTNLRLNVTGIKGDVKLSLFKASSETTPSVSPIEITLRPESKGTISESYNSTSDATLADLAAGTYYVKIERSGLVPVDSTYNLDVFASSSQKTVSALWRNPAGGLDIWQTTGSVIDAKGTFAATATPAGSQLMATADFDADGIDDILWKDTAKGQFYIWFMENGTVRKDNIDKYLEDGASTALVAKNSDWKIVGIEDIDIDGNIDLLLRNQVSGEMNAWFMKGSKLTNDVSLTTNGLRLYSDWQISGFSSGCILWRNTNNNAVVTWNIDRTGIKLGQLVVPIPISQDWKVVAFRDFNKDGIADVLWRNSQSETIVFWKMKNTFETPLEGVGYQVSNNFRISAIEDFTGDGRPDILFWNGKSKQVDSSFGGTIVLWETLGDGLTIKGSFVKQVTSDPNVTKNLDLQYEGFSAELVKDLDGDNKADILWRDKNNGQTVFWKMNGDTLVEGKALEVVPLSNVMPGIQYDGFRTTDSLNATTKKKPQFTAGLSVQNAFDLGVLDGSGSFVDRIGGNDRSDWYKFTVETASLLTGMDVLTAPPGAVETKIYTKRPNTTLVESNLNLVPKASLEKDVLEPNTYYINVVFSETYAAPGVPLPYTLNITGRLGITNLSLQNSIITLDKPSLVLDTDSTKNKVTIAAYQLENTGDFAASNVTVAYYLSKDGVLNAGDRLLTQVSNVGIAAKGIAEKVKNGIVTPGIPTPTNVGSIVLTLPSANDIYWTGLNGSNFQIIAVVNPANPTRTVVNERNFDDNAKASTPITISGLGNPDLTGGGFTVGSPIISNTGTATGTFTIKNIGSVTSTSSTPGQNLKVSFYFSTDGVFDKSSDLFLGDKFINVATGIAGNASLPGDYSFSLFQTDTTDPSVRSDFVKYWAAQGPANTKVSGFIGMIIDPASLFVDANASNNKNQGLLKDRVAVDVTIAAGTIA